MIKAIIIDDEKLARDIIRAYLDSHASIELVAECTNGFEGLKAIALHQPQLVFLDVQMPKITGFEMLELVEDMPAVIFSTAFDEYAIKAFEANAVDYLLKPYAKDRFDEAVEKALKVIKGQAPKPAIAEAVEKARQEEIDRLVVRSGSQIVMIPVEDIDYLEAQDDYVAIHTNGKKYLKQVRMKYLEEHLPSHDFVRAHRSYIVNIERIHKLEAYTKDSYIALLTSGEKVSVSRSGYQKLREVLNF